MTGVPRRWWGAVALGLAAAAALWLATGRWSMVLALGPLAFILGDALAARRKARLQAAVDRAFETLVGDDEGGFRARDAVVLQRRARLLGLPPRLVEIRIVRMPDARHYAVRAEARRSDPAAVRWRVARLTDAEAAEATRR